MSYVSKEKMNLVDAPPSRDDCERILEQTLILINRLNFNRERLARGGVRVKFSISRSGSVLGEWEENSRR